MLDIGWEQLGVRAWLHDESRNAAADDCTLPTAGSLEGRAE